MDAVRNVLLGGLMMLTTTAWTAAESGDIPETASTTEAVGDSDWEFFVAPYLWMAGMSGDVTVGDTQSDVNTPFSDILKNLDLGAECHVEVRRGHWGAILDPTYMKLSVEEEASVAGGVPVDAKIVMKEWLVEAGGFYRFGAFPLGGDEGNSVSVDALLGGRYWSVDSEIDVDVPTLGRGASGGVGKDWVDPFVGARVNVSLIEKVHLTVRGDLGGFGVGSDVAWGASGVVGYDFTSLISAWLGYRAVGVDYQGDSTGEVSYDLVMHGPLTGVGFRF